MTEPLEGGGDYFDSIPIKRGIFQDDSFSPMLFCFAINPLIFCLFRDIDMPFRFDNWNALCVVSAYCPSNDIINTGQKGTIGRVIEVARFNYGTKLITETYRCT